MKNVEADKRLVVYGAGGHGRVVAEAAGLAGFVVLGFLDDAQTQAGAAERVGRMGWAVLRADDARLVGAAVIVGIGDNMARRRLTGDLTAAGRSLATVVHPGASVSPSAVLEDGVFVGPGAVVHTGARVGRAAIVNSGAVVEHDCRIGAYAHLAPGAVLGGQVSVGALSLVGLGARVLPGLRIGERCVIAAGAAVVKDVAQGMTVAGVPGRELTGR